MQIKVNFLCSETWRENICKRTEPKGSHTLLSFLNLLEKLLSERFWLSGVAFVGVWKCARACVRSAMFTCTCTCVCGPARNKSGHSSPEVGVFALVERRPFISVPTSRDPSGDHMPGPGQESFYVFNIKSLEVPYWLTLRYRFWEPWQGFRVAKGIYLMHR